MMCLDRQGERAEVGGLAAGAALDGGGAQLERVVQRGAGVRANDPPHRRADGRQPRLDRGRATRGLALSIECWRFILNVGDHATQVEYEWCGQEPLVHTG